MSEASAILALAHRDFIKLLRDRQRMVADFAFPLIFIGILGTSLQAGFGSQAGGLNLLDYVFTGVLAQTVWQSSALGLISLLADREQDFSQEIFVSPISRYSIILGKILGESLVALPQALGRARRGRRRRGRLARRPGGRQPGALSQHGGRGGGDEIAARGARLEVDVDCGQGGAGEAPLEERDQRALVGAARRRHAARPPLARRVRKSG